MSSDPVVVKVGGSLFDIPDLGHRLLVWLKELNRSEIVLVPGGGPTADIVRAFDAIQCLGEESAHWLALRALTLNAHMLARTLPAGRSEVVEELEAVPAIWQAAKLPIVDGHAFAVRDEGQPGCLPHSWSVTSDSVAARVALVLGARLLILLKSCAVPAEMSWSEAGRRGLVDHYFASTIGRDAPEASSRLEVRAIDLRAWTPQGTGVQPGGAP